MRYEISDEELLYMVQQNDEWAMSLLLERYERILYPLTKELLRKQGCLEIDDALQMAFVGFLSAVQTYRPDRDVSFRYFARMCAEREVRSMLRKERFNHNRANYRSLSLDQMVKEEEGSYLVDFIENNHPEFNPSWYCEYCSLEEKYQNLLNDLNTKDRMIYELQLEGTSYKEIAQRMGMGVKAVDNTLQRVRKKLNRMFD
ncbi:MAG: sigma-70 family RNA polymerase sigma factor [Erysipelotrichaceae bacterium]|nr:sigma-70 family RNA polymerase sigma factor [Erysipelotrichaceae bacterium]